MTLSAPDALLLGLSLSAIVGAVGRIALTLRAARKSSNPLCSPLFVSGLANLNQKESIQ